MFVVKQVSDLLSVKQQTAEWIPPFIHGGDRVIPGSFTEQLPRL